MSFLKLSDLSQDQLYGILDIAASIKQTPNAFVSELAGMSIALLFQKTSTRTRVAFETGIAELGAHPVYMDWSMTNFSKGDIRDEIMCLGTYVKAIVARVFDHADLELMNDHTEAPIVNALSDKFHPTQVLADVFTLREHFGNLDSMTVAYVGDGNNICHSLMKAAEIFNFKLQIASPKSYAPKLDLNTIHTQITNTTVTNDPYEAVHEANVVYTDTWVSLGQEAETEIRREAFQHFTITEDLVRQANHDAVVMHCLPVYRGFEITDDVLDGSRAIIQMQAENKKYTNQALLMQLIQEAR